MGASVECAWVEEGGGAGNAWGGDVCYSLSE